ncbi:MAG: hypothetical protein H7833_12230 [Magnetococcus sp. DMHC-1]
MRHRPNKIGTLVFTFFKLCVLSIWLNATIQIIESADYPFIIKDSEVCMENREYVEVCERGGSQCNEDRMYSFFLTLCVFIYFLSLIIFPIIVYKIKGWERKIIWVTVELIPLLLHMLIYNINESIYYEWPKEKAIQEELLKDPAKNAINYWSFCNARSRSLNYVKSAECDKILIITKSYKN